LVSDLSSSISPLRKTPILFCGQGVETTTPPPPVVDMSATNVFLIIMPSLRGKKKWKKVQVHYPVGAASTANFLKKRVFFPRYYFPKKQKFD
jgi:hypothetical protein